MLTSSMNQENHDTHSRTPIGNTDFRNKRTSFYIKDKDRLSHMYVCGKSGVGKSTLLLNMVIADIKNGKGIAVLDPHSDLAEELLHHIPKERINDVVYFNPSDLDFAVAFNPLKGIHPDFHHLVASSLISTFKKIWIDSWGPRMEHILRFSLFALLEYPDGTLLDIQPLLTDKGFRETVLSHVQNQDTRSFWFNEFDKFSPTMRAEAVSPILNKLDLFLTSIPLKNTVGQKTRGFRIQQIMDEGKIFIANLSKGKMGEDACALLGCMLVTSFQMATLHRARQPEHSRRPFFLSIDEVHTFATLSFVDILSESRKFGLGLYMSSQFLNQLDPRILAAIFGNVATLVAFRVGSEDAATLAKEFYPTFSEWDLVHLPRYSMYLKLMIDGATSKPFNATTHALPKRETSHKETITMLSNSKYAKPRAEVEKDLLAHRFHRHPGNGQAPLFN